jgi:integrase
LKKKNIRDSKRNLETFEDVKNVIRFGLYAGMRIDSILNLKIENVKEGLINILQDKTTNGTRFIPVHQQLKNVIDNKITEKRDNEYLFFGKRRSKISDFINKYMQHTLQDKMKRHRSLRKNFITALDNNFPENVNYRRWLSGHSLAGVDNKNYIKNRDIDTLTKMINSISY